MAYRPKQIRSVLLARLNAIADGFEDPDVIVPDTDEPAWKSYMGRPDRTYGTEKPEGYR